MGVNLAKGQRVSLDKNMNMALIGLGWDTNRYDGGKDFDLDASAFLLNADGKVRKDEDFIFYGNLKSSDGSVRHTGGGLRGGSGSGRHRRSRIFLQKDDEAGQREGGADDQDVGHGLESVCADDGKEKGVYDGTGARGCLSDVL